MENHISEIQRVVANVCGVTIEQLTKMKSRGRKDVSDARMLAMAICVRLCVNTTYEKIAWTFNRADHTTVIHARDRVPELKNIYPDFRMKYERCMSALAHIVPKIDPEYFI